MTKHAYFYRYCLLILLFIIQHRPTCVIVQEALPDWKDKHDMLAALRACSYNPHQCIATYLDWDDISMIINFVAMISY